MKPIAATTTIRVATRGRAPTRTRLKDLGPVCACEVASHLVDATAQMIAGSGSRHENDNAFVATNPIATARQRVNPQLYFAT